MEEKDIYNDSYKMLWKKSLKKLTTVTTKKERENHLRSRIRKKSNDQKVRVIQSIYRHSIASFKITITLFAKLEILHEKSHDKISVEPRSQFYIQKLKVAFLSFSFSRGNEKLMLSSVKNVTGRNELLWFLGLCVLSFYESHTTEKDSNRRQNILSETENIRDTSMKI